MAVIAAYVVNAILNLVLGLLVAQILGPEEFGAFALGIAGASVLTTLSFEWLRLSATRHYSARVREAKPSIRATLDRAYGVIGLGLAGVALLCAAAWPFLGEPARMTAAAALAAIGIGVFDYHTALARALFVGRLYLRLVLVKCGLALVFMAGAAWATGSAAAVLAAVGIGQFLAALLLRGGLADAPHHPERPRGRAHLRRFLAYGLPLIAAIVVFQLMPFVNRGAVALTAGLTEAGYFALAADIGVRVFMTLGTALDVMLFQLAVRAEEAEGRAAGEAQVARNLALVAAILLPTAAGLWCVAPALEALAIPPAYRGHFTDFLAPLLPGFAATALLLFGLNPVFQIRRRTRPVIAAALVGLAANAAGIAALSGPFGAIGVAAAQSLGAVVALAFLSWRALTGPQRLRLPLSDLAGAVLATGLMTAALLPLRGLPPWLSLAASVPLGAALYAALAWRFDIAGLRGVVMAARPRRPAAAG
ncbi:lipopolysaccharide biosynthesis protein [Methylobacterium oryzisoli]|uniref:lipopolysaccharide biosynthesis protein n=1 Tax=Methylobacterium oryzisoli TaxID=3385502 RepID=UPI003892048A